MASPAEIATYIAANFDPRSSVSLDRAASSAIQALDGLAPAAAAAEAERRLPAIGTCLQGMEARELPFEFSIANPGRLIGKRRIRPDEDETARRARERLELAPLYLQVVLELGNRDFEFICAASMRMAGASDSRVTGSGDEGGIDFYGRIAVRPARPGIASTALTTSIVEREILYVGQSKCLAVSAEVDRATVSQFNSDVVALLSGYEGVHRRPSNRVPDDYYRRSETCLKLLFTTGRFAPGAKSFADMFDVILVSGPMLAQFLLFHGVGIREVDGAARVDPDLLRSWAVDDAQAPSVS